MLCCTRQPVYTCTEPLSMWTGKCTVSSRLTSRRPRRTSSERPITSAAASNRRWAVLKAVARISTAICGFRYYSGQRGEIFDFPAETTPGHDLGGAWYVQAVDGRVNPA